MGETTLEPIPFEKASPPYADDELFAIFDLDGTLADCEHRRHWLDKKRHQELTDDERWRAFFSACRDDAPNLRLIKLCNALWSEFTIVIFSGRSDEVRTETEQWLFWNGVKYDQIRMRQAGDFTPDEQLKESWLAELDPARILAVFDDRRKVVDMWRRNGLLCCQVAPGEF